MPKPLSTVSKVVIVVGLISLISVSGYLVYQDYTKRKLMSGGNKNKPTTQSSPKPKFNVEEEKNREQQFNQIAEKIIGTQPWGKFYGLMKTAADTGEGMIKHQICVSPDGREIEVAKTLKGKIVKSFIRPAHEHAAKAFSQKKYGEGIIGILGFGWIPNLIKQRRATCGIITPNDFLLEARKRGL